jgi:hypothetical protein
MVAAAADEPAARDLQTLADACRIGVGLIGAALIHSLGGALAVIHPKGIQIRP